MKARDLRQAASSSGMLRCVSHGREPDARWRLSRPQSGAGGDGRHARAGRRRGRLRVEACGLCGSDLHIFHSEPDRVRAGMTLGHELVGVIDAVGEGVAGWRIGDRATVEPLLSCGRCELCAAGFDNRCREYGLIELHRPGGFAERVVAQARRLYSVPRELDARVAALAEPVAVCVHGLRLGRFDAREPLLVLGAGTIGVLTVAVARLWGAADIAITARHAHQARVARELGASATLDPSSVREAAPSTTSFPLVIETVGGRADTLLDAAAAVGPGGRILVLGVFQDEVRPRSLAASGSRRRRSPGPSATRGRAARRPRRQRQRSRRAW